LLSQALEISKQRGLARYETIQNEFNLYTRDSFEGPVQDLCVREGISGLAYYGLASGFLTGKYRSEADFSKSPRGARMANYLDQKGRRILAALDAVSARTGATLAEISIAWIIAQPGIGAPIASATSVEQLQSLMRGARLQLSAEDLRELTEAGR
ncbi:MAG: aldo/keto reductase, partial [Myxococcaceae bacterium]